MADERDWDKGLHAAFGAAPDLPHGDRSILAAIERATGASAQVLLRDAPDDPSPLLKLHPPDSEEAAKDDSRYQVVGEIARGGVGVIFKGRDRDLGRDVAIKVLRKEHAARPEIVQRFIEEAQIEGQLQHPGIIPVYGLGLQPDGRPYFAMKLVKGKTLAALLAKRPDPAEDRALFLAMFEQVAQAMAYAHARGVIHRDLKPSNILVGAFGEVLVVDWGFAKVLGTKEPQGPATPPLTIVETVRTTGEGSESLAGSVMGTPAYMPPEQALGHIDKLDARSDVFALGAVLAEILTGQPPYVGDSDDQLVMASQGRLEKAHGRLAACAADPELIRICRDCLQPLKRDRPRDAGAVAKALSQHLATVEERAREAEVDAARERARVVRERRESEKERAREASERRQVEWERLARRRTIGVAAALLLAVVLGGGAFLWAQSDRRARAERAQAAVARTVEEAEELRGERRWPEAIEKARSAAELARVDGVPEATRTETATLLDAIEIDGVRASEQAARAAKDRAFVTQLEEIYLAHAERFDAVRTDARFEKAFREHGIDVDELGPEEAGRRIAASTRAVEIAASLDAWAWLAYIRDEVDRDPGLLLEAARIADPDPLRVRLRRATAEGDRTAVLEIAEKAESEDLPERTLDAIACWFWEWGAPEKGVEILRLAQKSHPGSFWVNYHLASFLDGCEPHTGEAVRYAMAATALRPGSPRAWNILGGALAHAGDRAGATAAFRRALDADPDADFARGNLALSLWSEGDLAAAEATARDALDRSPDKSSAHLALGVVLQSSGRHGEALEAFRESVRLNPGYYYGYYWQCWAHLMLGKPEEAAEVARKALTRCRYGFDRAECLAVLGQALALAGRLDEALRSCEEAVRIDPRSSLAHRIRCFVLTNLRRLDEAVEAGQESLRHCRGAPERAECLSQLGDTLRMAGRPAEAVAALREATGLCPHLAAPWQRLAIAHAAKGDWEEAIGAGREAERRCGGDDRARAECLVVIGRGLSATGRGEEALAAWRRALELAPHLVEAHQRIGEFHFGRGEFDEAEKAFREILRAAPKSSVGHVGLGNVHGVREDLPAAEAEFREALRLNPIADGAWYGLGRLHHLRGEVVPAIEALEKAVALAPGLADSRYMLAQAYMASGRWGEAIEACREAVRLRPDGYLALNCLAWFLAICPDPEVADAEEAVRHAERAVELAPGMHQLWNTLGVARYRAGTWVKAREAIEKSLSLGSDHATNPLFLAMCHQRLGEKAKARECFAAALALAGRLQGEDEAEFARFRAEAEALLGIEREGR